MKQILLVVIVWLIANSLVFLLGYGRSIPYRKILKGMLFANIILAVGLLVWLVSRRLGLHF